MRRIPALLLIIVAMLMAPFALAEEAPDALVKRLATAVTAVIRNDQDIQAGDTQKVKDLIETKMLPHFDFHRMTAMAMGRNWRKASGAQRKILVDHFRTLLERRPATSKA